jgi:16S rRNA (guanine1207-N2)-methyltransferase
VTGEEPDELLSPDQYFTERPRSPSARSEHRFLYRGELLTFVVDRGVFGSHGLDPGTSLLIENLAVAKTDRVLDLGCGWGPVGVAAARAAREGHVVLTEVNRRAARLARLNLERNHAENAEVRVGNLFEPVADERFDIIATNPPYRAGRSLILELVREAPDHLNPGGRLLIVGKGTQGILYYQERLEEQWPGPVEVLGRRSGYRVLEARRDPVKRKP